MRIADIALSHVLSILLSGVIGYLELCLVCRDYVSINPVLGVMIFEILFILPWIYVVRKIYTWLYPPRQMLVIYGAVFSRRSDREDQYKEG